MKRLLGFALALLAFVAFVPLAQAQCSMTMTETVFFNKAKVYESSMSYPGSLTKEEADSLHAKGQTVLDIASKVQDKKGGYDVEFGETTSCDGGPPKPTGGARVEGVTAAGLNKIHRQALKVGGDIIRDAEQNVAKGKKKAWGKE